MLSDEDLAVFQYVAMSCAVYLGFGDAVAAVSK